VIADFSGAHPAIATLLLVWLALNVALVAWRLLEGYGSGLSIVYRKGARHVDASQVLAARRAQVDTAFRAGTALSDLRDVPARVAGLGGQR
jgi:hypothetical protein